MNAGICYKQVKGEEMANYGLVRDSFAEDEVLVLLDVALADDGGRGCRRPRPTRAAPGASSAANADAWTLTVISVD